MYVLIIKKNLLWCLLKDTLIYGSSYKLLEVIFNAMST